ncbi:hypothetical protein NC653_028848 [Populus alba x Populus x berolinensis]|uniref:Uncharacterized protein n=1 Tax=Populus alba x Populus x berolinensis TaxID=444605 RepID=A0AAD6M0Q8_9ROSI|nr:hypothetical protein NC653_028848 [Populus alba x Populus x berolinensis]
MWVEMGCGGGKQKLLEDCTATPNPNCRCSHCYGNGSRGFTLDPGNLLVFLCMRHVIALKDLKQLIKLICPSKMQENTSSFKSSLCSLTNYGDSLYLT